jgi:hypothetical protein
LTVSEEQSKRANCLSPTPEAFLQWTKLLHCDRTYLSERYRRCFEFLLGPARRKLLLMPRGTYKSTILCAYVTRAIANNPDIRILYGSETYAQSKTYLAWVRRQLEANADLRKLIGDMVGRVDWRNDTFTVKTRKDLSKKESTLTAAGIDVTKVGMHYDLIIIDDCVSNTNTMTAGQMQKTLNWYRLLIPILEPDGTIIVCGTRYDEEDLYGEIIKSNVELEKIWNSLPEHQRRPELMPFEVMVERAETDGKPHFEHLDDAALRVKRSTLGPYLYACQFQNDPTSRENAIFNREMFKVIPADQIPKALNTYMLTDSATTADGCQSALFVIGKDQLDNVYVLDGWAAPATPDVFEQMFFSLYTKWWPRHFLMEKVPINDNYATLLMRTSRERQIPIRLEWVMGRSTESKDERIISMQARFAAGKIFFSDALPADLIHLEGTQAWGDIPRQFCRFRPRSGSRNDIPDCLSDMDKRDHRTNSELCPAPRFRAQRPTETPGTVNGQFNPKPLSRRRPGPAARENFWEQQRRLSDTRRSNHG